VAEARGKAEAVEAEAEVEEEVDGMLAVVCCCCVACDRDAAAAWRVYSGLRASSAASASDGSREECGV
jgi:hypothetical protein